MTTIKSYSDLQQSKKLAEILPLESADMWYSIVDNEPFICLEQHYEYEQIPAWSLAALLSVLRTFTSPTAFSVKVSVPSLIKTEDGYKLTYIGDYTPMINNELDVEAPIESVADNPVDACYELILKLNELNML